MNFRELWAKARPWHAVIAAQLVLQVASIAALSRALGIAGYDAWLAGQVQCALLLLLFSPGLEPWLVRRLAEARSEQERQALIARTGELLLASHAVILGIAFAGGTFDLWPATGIVALFAATSGIDLARRLLVAERQSRELHARAAALELSGDVARLGGAIAVGCITGSPLGAALGMLAATAMLAQLCVPSLTRLGFPLPWSPAARAARRAAPPFRAVLRDALALACSKNATALGREVLPALFLAHGGRAGELALFRATARWVELPVRFLGGFARALLPAQARTGTASLTDASWRAGARIAMGILAVALLFACAAPWVVALLLGRDVEGALGIGLLLAIGSACLGFGVGLDLLALARRALRAQALANLLWLGVAAMFGALTIAQGGALAAAATTALFAAGVFVHRCGWARLERP